jgi:hypothetical protein
MRRQLGGRGHLFAGRFEASSTTRAARRNYCLHHFRGRLDWLAPPAEQPLARLAPGASGMGHRLTFGKRRRLTLPPTTQFFHFLLQPLNHLLLLHQQSDQFRAAQ